MMDKNEQKELLSHIGVSIGETPVVQHALCEEDRVRLDRLTAAMDGLASLMEKQHKEGLERLEAVRADAIGVSKQLVEGLVALSKGS